MTVFVPIGGSLLITIARIRKYHVPSFSAEPSPRYLGDQPTSAAENSALAAALANEDFIQSLAMYTLTLDSLSFGLGT